MPESTIAMRSPPIGIADQGVFRSAGPVPGLPALASGAPSGENFVGSTITATRFDDSGQADSMLTGERFLATAVARFSDYTQSYGVFNGGSFSAVLVVSGFGGCGAWPSGG